jgi:hypothetical protein
MTPQRGIVPMAKPKPAPSAQAAPPPNVPPKKMPAPAGFDPKKFMAAMNTYATAWQQLSNEDKLRRIVAYLPTVKDPNALVGALTATDDYAYMITSPRGPLMNGPPVGKAAPTVVSPQQPRSMEGANPNQGFITDVQQAPVTKPFVAMPQARQVVVFDRTSGRMVTRSGQTQTDPNADTAQASAGFSFFQIMLAFGAGAATVWLLSMADE